MAITITMYKKDLLPGIVFKMKDRNGKPINLAAATVTFSMGIDSTQLTINQRPLVLSSIVEQDGTVCWSAALVWQSPDTDIPGDYLGEVVVTFPGGKMQSASGPFNVTIADSLRP